LSTALHIARLDTRVRAADPVLGQHLGRQVREALDGPLARALDDACPRALARAGLPPDAFVRVRRLRLRLLPRPGVDSNALANGWAGALEEALVRALEAHPRPGTGDALAWYPDDWTAQLHALRSLAEDRTPWWADSLPGARGPSTRPRPAEVLLGWIADSPARAIADMAGLVVSAPALVGLLDAGEAGRLVSALTRALDAATASARPAAPGPAGERRDQGAPGRPAASGKPLAHQVERILAAIAPDIPDGLRAATAAQRAPWLLALALARLPALSSLPPGERGELLRALVERAGDRTPARDLADPRGRDARGETAPQPPGRLGAEAGDRPEASAGRAGADAAPVEDVETLAGGLLLLIRHLARSDRLSPLPDLGERLADLALTALRRVLAPLPRAESMAAQERERALLAVFAPGRPWRDPIHTVPVRRPELADALLDTLVAAIPADIGAPAGLRRLFGPTGAAYGDAADRRLAYLLLRPGRLVVTHWSAELTWPLAAVDIALRRAGWDQDPGWVPWLGRVIRFRYGEPR
jgi:hypothetical protein